MNRYKLPYTKEQIQKLDEKFGTPFLIYSIIFAILSGLLLILLLKNYNKRCDGCK